MIAPNGKIYAEIEWCPETDDGCAGLMVEYFIVPTDWNQEQGLMDFYPDGDFDRSVIDLYRCSIAAQDLEKFEKLLRGVKEYHEQYPEVYTKRSDEQIMFIRYDHTVSSWVFSDNINGYRFEPELSQAAKHLMDFEQGS